MSAALRPRDRLRRAALGVRRLDHRLRLAVRRAGSADHRRPRRPLWRDIGVVAAFSLVIYFWAMRVALTRDRIEEMIGDVVLPEADSGVA
jgi:hypothetical protein